MKPSDIGALVEVGEPRLSPDGAAVAVVVTTVDMPANGYRSRVWLVPVNGGVPTPLTSEASRHVHVCWSPDGSEIAYVEAVDDDDDDDDGGSIVWVQSVSGGQPR